MCAPWCLGAMEVKTEACLDDADLEGVSALEAQLAVLQERLLKVKREPVEATQNASVKAPVESPVKAPVKASPLSDTLSAEGGARDAQERSLLPMSPESPSSAPIKLPEGICAPIFKDRRERATAWAKYMRSITGGASKSSIADDQQRSKRSGKAPDNVMSQLVGAHEKSFYFSVWMANGGDWAKVEGWEEHYLERKYGAKRTCAWMTDGQMMEVWHDRDICDGLQAVCVSEHTPANPMVRQHPKLPNLMKARQYNVQVEDTMVEQVTNVVKGGIRMSYQLEGDTGTSIALQHVAQSRQCFGTDAKHAEPGLGAHRQIAPLTASNPGSFGEPAATPLAAPEKLMADEDASKADRLRKFAEQEAAKARRQKEKAELKAQAAEDRRNQRESEKEARRAEAQTPVGRARIWLAGLDQHIRICQDEASRCKTDQCKLPSGLKHEYASSWQKKSTSFKKARTSIEKMLNGDSLPGTFDQTICKAEADVTDFKSDMARFRTLEKGYTTPLYR